ncbi:MAG TPA: DMT family transporter [Candidatus Limnocylindrales bacterium]|nr:DMT family transporter [Candidatus Limnocylindrales bacterium]
MSSPSVTATHTRLPAFGGFGIVIASAALFGMLGPLSRFAYEAGMDPTSFVAWRAGVGLVALALVIAWGIRRGTMRLVRLGDLSTRDRAALLIAGCMGFTLNLAMFIAFDRITIALALLGFYTYPAMVAVVSVVLGRERLDRIRLVALGLAIVGMAAVVAAQLDPAAAIRFDVIGVALALGAALSQTVYVVVSRDGYRSVPAEQAIFVVLVISSIGAAVVAIVAGGGLAALVYPFRSPSVLPLLVFTGIVTAAIPSLGFLRGIRAIGGMRAGILMLFEPVVGVALAAWLLGEALAPVQAVGAAAILIAALLLQRSHAAADDDVERAPVVPVGP